MQRLGTGARQPRAGSARSEARFYRLEGVADAPSGSAAVVSEWDGRRHVVVLCASGGATLRRRNHSCSQFPVNYS